ncbi:DUF397 domain-containing protein [Nocardia jiangxiensis]|uniref:DUF397 domain-containing protein n=1 Tax=Nocardia jiangxiensis TaxID=282685 RepID=A0ABW6SFF9_9NOCA|nr:DUF397 domain-containing protein [Nocardia jiangxiensis]
MSIDVSAAKWFKSSRSMSSRYCVEVAGLDGGMVGVRDSKNPVGPVLVFSSSEWDAFTAGVQNGAFNQPA